MLIFQGLFAAEYLAIRDGTFTGGKKDHIKKKMVAGEENLGSKFVRGINMRKYDYSFLKNGFLEI